MGKRIATVQWSDAGAGDVFALVHPGGLLLTPIKVLHVGIESMEHLELRLEFARYAAKGTGGSIATSHPLADDNSNGVAEVRYGAFTLVGSPLLTAKERRRTTGQDIKSPLLDDELFTIAPNRSLKVTLLDAVPNAARGAPIAFVVKWEE